MLLANFMLHISHIRFRNVLTFVWRRITLFANTSDCSSFVVDAVHNDLVVAILYAFPRWSVGTRKIQKNTLGKKRREPCLKQKLLKC
jgi:hypothetical protein